MTTARPPRYFPCTTIDPPPDWWATSWVRRQMEIRRGVRSALKARRVAVGRDVIEETALWFFLRLVRYEAGEVEAALEGMVGDGVLVKNGACYSLSHRHECLNSEVIL